MFLGSQSASRFIGEQTNDQSETEEMYDSEKVDIMREILKEYIKKTYTDVIAADDLHDNVFQNKYNQAYILYSDTSLSAVYIDLQKQAIHTYNTVITTDNPNKLKIYNYDVFKSDFAGCVTFLWLISLKLRLKLQTEIPFD